MGELLKSKFTAMENRCRECGKLEEEDADDFIHTFDEVMDLSEEEKKACEWFTDTMEEKTFPDLAQMTGNYSREEIIHIFILENLIEKLLARKPICETCFVRKRSEKNLS